MNLARVASVVVVGFLATTVPCARSHGSRGGGGHGGSGGHGSGGHGSGGHVGRAAGSSSAGNSSGHSVVHAMGRPFAKIFGHPGKQSTAPQLPTASPERGKFLNSQNTSSISLPVPRLLRPQPFPRSATQLSFGFFPHRRCFAIGGCTPFAVLGNSFLFGNSFSCFNNGFFFDPFFFDAFSGLSFYGPPFDRATFYGSTPGEPLWFGGVPGAPRLSQSAEEPGLPDSSTSAQPGNDFSNSGETVAPPANQSSAQRPVTLLQLRDGSMYGLTDYWVEGGELHYKTSYGGQNSVSFEQIDFEKTFKLNADSGLQFILRPSHASP